MSIGILEREGRFMGLREYKGQSLVEFPNEYICFDLETTSRFAQHAKITEIAAVHVKNGVICDKFSSLINPNRKIPEDIEALNGITNKMIETAPTIKDILPQLMNFLGDKILVAHNGASFDINVLYDAYEENGAFLKNDFVDTLRIAKLILPDLENHKLSTLANFFHVDPGTAHRAEADAITTVKCFEAMKENISPIWGAVIVFTGAMFNMPIRQAKLVVKKYGGIYDFRVTKKTNILVVGRGVIHDWIPQVEKSKNEANEKNKSSDIKKAKSYQQSGQNISIMSEDEFFKLINFQGWN